MGVPLCLILFLHILQPTLNDASDPCDTYTVLNDTWRATTNLNWTNTECDWDPAVPWQGWYRMFHQGVSRQMPDSCVPREACGAYAQMWLDGSHPHPEDGIVTRSVCARWEVDCCYYKQADIQVKACPGGYTVYKLLDPGFCNLVYCIEVPPTTPAPTTPSPTTPAPTTPAPTTLSPTTQAPTTPAPTTLTPTTTGCALPPETECCSCVKRNIEPKTHFQQRLRLKVVLQRELSPSEIAQQIKEKLIQMGHPSDITVKMV